MPLYFGSISQLTSPVILRVKEENTLEILNIRHLVFTIKTGKEKNDLIRPIIVTHTEVKKRHVSAQRKHPCYC